MNVSVEITFGIVRILVESTVEQLLVALADHLDEQVVGAGGDHHVVDLVERGDRVGDRLELARCARIPIIACRAKPSSSGSVTATTCITPLSTSRCTRCRTAASERPTTLPIAAYERRPSCWSCSMIDLDTSSSTAPWPVDRAVPLRAAAAVHRPIVARPARWPVKTWDGVSNEGFRCRNVSVPLNPLFIWGASDKIH